MNYGTRRYILLKIKAINYKGGRCQNCNYDKFYGALEFHHRDPTKKEFIWTKMRCKSWTTIKVELDKCDLLCSNCHKEVHANNNLLKEALEFSNKIKENKIKERTCPTCSILFRPKMNKIKYCSKSCAAFKQKTKIQWPDNLLDLIKSSSLNAVGKLLGVSHRSVKKRLRNHFMVSRTGLEPVSTDRKSVILAN